MPMTVQFKFKPGQFVFDVFGKRCFISHATIDNVGDHAYIVKYEGEDHTSWWNEAELKTEQVVG